MKPKVNIGRNESMNPNYGKNEPVDTTDQPTDWDLLGETTKKMSQKYEWNEPQLRLNATNSSGAVVNQPTGISTLKNRLANPGSVRIEYIVVDIAKGLALIMDQLEKENK